jgi:hypothetical protein
MAEGSVSDAIYERVLEAPLPEGHGSGAKSIKEFFLRLAREVMAEGESFSGKRPFGNSGWECDLYIALGNAGVMPSCEDEDGYYDPPEDFDDRQADRLLVGAVDYMIRELA